MRPAKAPPERIRQSDMPSFHQKVEEPMTGILCGVEDESRGWSSGAGDAWDTEMKVERRK